MPGSSARRYERAMRFGTQLVGDLVLDEATRRNESAEAQLAEMERMLGTDEQVQGKLGVDPYVAAYQGRYRLDEGVANQIGAQRYGVPSARFQQSLEEANSLMAQAEAAARNGDLTEARRLRDAAQNATKMTGLTPENTGLGERGIRSGLAAFGEPYERAFRFEEDPTTQAAVRLGSPTAKLVGGLVRDAGELQDPTSQRFGETLDTLTAGQLERIDAERTMAERGLAADFRSAEGQRRDLAAGRGAARSRFGEAAMASRSAEAAGTARANLAMEASAQAAEVMGQASQFLTTWTKEFARDTAGFAQAWLQNEPTVRRSYLDALDQVSFTTANFYNQLNARAVERLSFLDSLKQEEKLQKLSLIVSSVTSLVGFGLGAAFGGGGGGAGGSLVSSGWSAVMDRLSSRSALERSVGAASQGVATGGRWGASPALSASLDLSRYPLLSGSRPSSIASSLIPDSATQLTSASRF